MKKVMLIPLVIFATQSALGQMVGGTAEQNAAQQQAAQQAALQQQQAMQQEAAAKQAAMMAEMANAAAKAAAMMAAAMLAAVAAAEASQCPTAPPMCAMAALHAMMAMMAAGQGGEHGNVQGQAANTGANTDAYGSADNSITRDDAGDGKMGAIDDNMKKLLKGIDGAKLNPDGSVSYNGNNLSNVDPNSPESLRAAGFSDSQIAQALAANKKLNDAVNSKYGAMTADNGYAEGGGGAAGSAPIAAPSLVFGKKAGLDRNPANIAGMQKNFNGEPIGVAGDNIFEMMKRRYVAKDRQSAFYDEFDLALKQK